MKDNRLLSSPSSEENVAFRLLVIIFLALTIFRAVFFLFFFFFDLMENRLPQTTRVLCEPSVAGWQNIISHRGFKGMRAWCASTPSRPANERRVFLFISLVNFKKLLLAFQFGWE